MIQHSETIGMIAAALKSVQTELGPVLKNSTNPFLNTRYADLGVIIDAAKKLLPKNGLSYAQFPTGSGGEVGVATILMHESGEWLSDEISIAQVDEKGKSAAQVAGSIITYLRRYALSAALGIHADEDTDGNQPPRQPQQGKSGGVASPAQISTLTKALAAVGLEGEDAGREVSAFLGRQTEGPSDLTTAEASRAIDHFKGLANGQAVPR